MDASYDGGVMYAGYDEGVMYASCVGRNREANEECEDELHGFSPP